MALFSEKAENDGEASWNPTNADVDSANTETPVREFCTPLQFLKSKYSGHIRKRTNVKILLSHRHEDKGLNTPVTPPRRQMSEYSSDSTMRIKFKDSSDTAKKTNVKILL
ncbi:hypothetical protein RRG08_032510 [Elysia crispata]|uniref:Uncharacterized protein n=1 Tax=Elysia crispata TaxID=231223 RepID=A0AAE1DNL4_9GAST|nr:hypothetical protein RRG08_032510 [Elysia crispata]